MLDLRKMWMASSAAKTARGFSLSELSEAVVGKPLDKRLQVLKID